MAAEAPRSFAENCLSPFPHLFTLPYLFLIQSFLFTRLYYYWGVTPLFWLAGDRRRKPGCTSSLTSDNLSCSSHSYLSCGECLAVSFRCDAAKLLHSTHIGHERGLQGLPYKPRKRYFESTLCVSPGGFPIHCHSSYL